MQFITNWAQGIIISVIIATIIEMLLPNNGNGKYVKVVIGVFVLFTIVSPIINKFKNDNYLKDFDSYIKNNDSQTVSVSNNKIDTENTIRKMYEENLKVDIKSKVSQKGYVVGNINLEILDNKEYTLNKILIQIRERKQGNVSNNKNQNTTTIIENIENIKVSLGGSSKDNEQQEKSVISESEKRKLKDYLSSVYEVNDNNIVIN